jgi:hypothetical protein
MEFSGHPTTSAPVPNAYGTRWAIVQVWTAAKLEVSAGDWSTVIQAVGSHFIDWAIVARAMELAT